MASLATHYLALSQLSSKTCLSLSRYFAMKARLLRPEKTDEKTVLQACKFCCSQFTKGNHTVRMVEKSKLSPRIQKLISRQLENPSSLGRFQRKLVQDYLISSNKLVIKCNVCKKSAQISGQSRQQQQQQREIRLAQQLEVQVQEVPKTKKEKKKEKKKLMKKKRKLQKGDDNAGLAIPDQPNIDQTVQRLQGNNKTSESQAEETFDSSQKKIPVSDVLTASLQDIPNVHESPTCTGKSEQDSISPVTNPGNGSEGSESCLTKEAKCPTVKGGNSETLLRPAAQSTETVTGVNKKHQGQLLKGLKYPSSGGGNSKSLLPLMGLPPLGTGINKGKQITQKKKKTMKMTQQLNRMLKEDQSKKSETSLSDFLSSL